MTQYWKKWRLTQLIVTIFLAFLLTKGADYLIKSGNSDTLVIVSSILIAVGYSEIIMGLLRSRIKELSKKEQAEQLNQS